jgi:hypothetical protein
MTSPSIGDEKIYVDGSYVTDGTDQNWANGTSTFTSTVYIGAYQSASWDAPYPTGFFEGFIDDVRIYTNTLSDTDISTLYRNKRK